MTARLVIIDYGMGNLHSAAKALERVGEGEVEVRVSGDPELIRAADKVVFPGVGAIRDCMAELERRELVDVVRQAAAEKPFLAICVGMQALMSRSAENEGVDCLDWFAGRVERFPEGLSDDAGRALKVPHMGWNRVEQCHGHPLWQGIEDGERFYFVHSYYAVPDEPGVEVGRCRHGVAFAAALARANVFAVQFHPEKSQKAGLRLLRNFTGWDGRS